MNIENTNTEKGNFKALHFSPHFWWLNIERGVYLSESFGKEIIPDFDFRKWLKEDKIEHSSTKLIEHENYGHDINPEYEEAIKNEYFFEVFTTNKYGHKVSAKNIEDLHKKYQINDDAILSYSFKIADLNHFVSMYLQNWLLFDVYYDWVKWQLYFDFILLKIDEPIRGLYQYMWSVVLNQVEFQDNLFKDITQYKKFRDKLDHITKESAFIEKKFAEIRDLKSGKI